MPVDLLNNDKMTTDLAESALDSDESEDEILTARRRAQMFGSFHAPNVRADVSPRPAPTRQDDYVNDCCTPQASTTPSEQESDFLDRHYRHMRGNRDDQGWVQLKLTNFTIFEKIDSSEPISLHTVADHEYPENPEYCFSGTLVYDDGTTQELKYAEIFSIQIDNLADLGDRLTPITNTCRGATFLQTRCAKLYNCFYVLETPSPAYELHFASFTWLADFMKHIVDFLIWAVKNDQIIRLADFQVAFILKLREWHGNNEEFRAWHGACGSISDFRHHVTSATNTSFIYNQVYNIADGLDDPLLCHKLWDEIGVRAGSPSISKEDQRPRRTLVTAHAAKCFLPTFPLWGRKGFNILSTVTVGPETVRWQADRRQRLGLRDLTDYQQDLNFVRHGGTIISQAALKLENSSKVLRSPRSRPFAAELAREGVVLLKHTDDCMSVPCSCSAYRYAYVCSQEGQQLKVRWLTLPSQTVCAGRGAGRDPRRPKTFYPIGNELFWTDECTCGSVSTRDVVAVFKLLITQGCAPQTGLFVQFQYTHRDLAIQDVTLEDMDACPLHSRGHLSGGAVDKDSGPSLTVHTLSLFSGCGLFDLGVEEGSAQLFETVLAVDSDHAALLSFAANHKNPSVCEFCKQDVNIIFREFCTGVRELSGFGLLIAGCPCQGYSCLNSKRGKEKSQRNCSLLAQTMSWIELFLPEMVLIENVPTMDPIHHKGEPSAAGQAVSFLVSLGYQAKLTTMKASNYGAATGRTRLFIIATRPGIPLPDIPKPTHGEDQGLLPLNTAATVTTDLAVVDNDVMLNIKHPDHVPFERLITVLHNIVSKIPRAPPRRGTKNNLWSARLHLNSEELEWYSERTEEQQTPRSSCLARVSANKPIGALVTSISPLDSRTGTTVHWVQNRLLTLMEMRRCQSIPDDFVLIGLKTQQMRQLGNSVVWRVGNVLGEALRLSWRKRSDPPVSETHPRASSATGQPSSDETVDGARAPKTQEREEVFYKEDGVVTDMNDNEVTGELPELKVIFTPTPPRKTPWIRTDDNDDNDLEMPNIDEVLTPTRSHRKVTRKSTASEKLQIKLRGSVLFETHKKSSVTVHGRGLSSGVESPTRRGGGSSFVQRLEASKVRAGSGLTIEDAIMLD